MADYYLDQDSSYEDRPGPVSLDGVPVSFSDYVGAAYESNTVLNPVKQIRSLYELRQLGLKQKGYYTDEFGNQHEFTTLGLEPDDPRARRLSLDEANEAGKEMGLRFSEPPTQGQFDYLADLKRKENSRARILSNSPGIVATSAGFLAGLAATATDPLNIAVGFVPIVGEVRYASWVARHGRTVARLGKGAVEGFAGTLPIVPFTGYAASQLQQQYGVNEAFMDLVMGTALGAGLHWGGGVALDAYRGKFHHDLAEFLRKHDPSEKWAEAIRSDRRKGLRVQEGDNAARHEAMPREDQAGVLNAAVKAVESDQVPKVDALFAASSRVGDLAMPDKRYKSTVKLRSDLTAADYVTGTRAGSIIDMAMERRLTDKKLPATPTGVFTYFAKRFKSLAAYSLKEVSPGEFGQRVGNALEHPDQRVAIEESTKTILATEGASLGAVRHEVERALDAVQKVATDGAGGYRYKAGEVDLLNAHHAAMEELAEERGQVPAMSGRGAVDEFSRRDEPIMGREGVRIADHADETVNRDKDRDLESMIKDEEIAALETIVDVNQGLIKDLGIMDKTIPPEERVLLDEAAVRQGMGSHVNDLFRASDKAVEDDVSGITISDAEILMRAGPEKLAEIIKGEKATDQVIAEVGGLTRDPATAKSQLPIIEREIKSVIDGLNQAMSDAKVWMGSARLLEKDFENLDAMRQRIDDLRSGVLDDRKAGLKALHSLFGIDPQAIRDLRAERLAGKLEDVNRVAPAIQGNYDAAMRRGQALVQDLENLREKHEQLSDVASGKKLAQIESGGLITRINAAKDIKFYLKRSKQELDGEGLERAIRAVQNGEDIDVAVNRETQAAKPEAGEPPVRDEEPAPSDDQEVADAKSFVGEDEFDDMLADATAILEVERIDDKRDLVKGEAQIVKEEHAALEKTPKARDLFSSVERDEFNEADRDRALRQGDGASEGGAGGGAGGRGAGDTASARLQAAVVGRDSETVGGAQPAIERERAAPGGERPAPETTLSYGGWAIPRRVITPDGSVQVGIEPRIVEFTTLAYERAEERVTSFMRAMEFDPGRMLPSNISDTGAPLVYPNPDGTYSVISGRKRSASLAEIYLDETLEFKALQYRERLGPAADGYRNPVLVSVITDLATPAELDALAKASNSERISGLKTAEQYRQDASRIAVMALYKGGDVTSKQNRDFVQIFTKYLTSAEEREAFSKKGKLTSAGIDRLNAAIFSAAYDDTDTLSRMIVSADPNIKSIAHAYRDVAPAFMKLRREIAQGLVREDMDITASMMRAASLAEEMQDKGVKIIDAISKIDALDPVVDRLIRQFYNPQMTKVNSPLRIAGNLQRFIDGAREKLVQREVDTETVAGVDRQAGVDARTGEQIDDAEEILTAADENAGRSSAGSGQAAPQRAPAQSRPDADLGGARRGAEAPARPTAETKSTVVEREISDSILKLNPNLESRRIYIKDIIDNTPGYSKKEIHDALMKMSSEEKIVIYSDDDPRTRTQERIDAGIITPGLSHKSDVRTLIYVQPKFKEYVRGEFKKPAAEKRLAAAKAVRKTKIIDAKGNPIEMYRGGTRGIDFAQGGETEPGVFFTSNRVVASQYAQYRSAQRGEPGAIYSAFLNVRKPYETTREGYLYKEVNGKKVLSVSEAKKKGYDAYLIRDERGNIEVAVFDPSQIHESSSSAEELARPVSSKTEKIFDQFISDVQKAKQPAVAPVAAPDLRSQLEGMKVPEIRAKAKAEGLEVKGRSKEQIIDSYLKAVEGRKAEPAPAPEAKPVPSTLQDFTRASGWASAADRMDALKDDGASLLKRGAFLGKAKVIVERLVKKAGQLQDEILARDLEGAGDTLGDMVDDAARLTELDPRPESNAVTQWVRSAAREVNVADRQAKAIEAAPVERPKVVYPPEGAVRTAFYDFLEGGKPLKGSAQLAKELGIDPNQAYLLLDEAENLGWIKLKSNGVYIRVPRERRPLRPDVKFEDGEAMGDVVQFQPRQTPLMQRLSTLNNRESAINAELSRAADEVDVLRAADAPSEQIDDAMFRNNELLAQLNEIQEEIASVRDQIDNRIDGEAAGEVPRGWGAVDGDNPIANQLSSKTDLYGMLRQQLAEAEKDMVRAAQRPDKLSKETLSLIRIVGDRIDGIKKEIRSVLDEMRLLATALEKEKFERDLQSSLALQRAVVDGLKRVPESVQIQILDKIEVAGFGPARGGMFPYTMPNGVRGALIQVLRGVGDAVNLVNHEIFHALRTLGLFSKLEWRIVKEAMAEKSGLSKETLARYEPYMRMRAEMMDLHPSMDRHFIEDKLVEERAARDFGEWISKRGSERETAIGRLWGRAKDFMEDLRQSFTNIGRRARGLQKKPSLEQIYRAIEDGSFARRYQEWGLGHAGADNPLSVNRQAGDEFAAFLNEDMRAIAHDDSESIAKATETALTHLAPCAAYHL